MSHARRNVWDLDIDVLEDDVQPSWRAELADLPAEDVDWVFREVPRPPFRATQFASRLNGRPSFLDD